MTKEYLQIYKPDEELYIPTFHIMLMVHSWSHDLDKHNCAPSHIASSVCDIVVDYVYTLPDILFNLRRPISRELLFKSIPNIQSFNDKYDIIKPTHIIKGFFGTTNTISHKNERYVSKTMHHQLFMLSKKQQTITRRIINDNIDTLTTVNHRNIAELKELYKTSQKSITYVSKYCDGGSLLQRIIRGNATNINGQWSEYDVSVIIKQILKSLHFMHNEMNMVHGHLTPSKILFTDRHSLDIQINGFYVGKSVLSSLSKTRHFNKTIHYKSPETITKNTYSHSSDMFAVGIIAYLLLFGDPPFHASDGYHHFGTHETKLVSRHIRKGFYNKIRNSNKHGKGAWFPNDIICSNEASDFIGHLLEYNPKKRITAKYALTHPFITNRYKLKQNIISKKVIESIQHFHHQSIYKQYLVQVFTEQYHAMKPKCFNAFKTALHQMDETDQMMDVDRVVEIAESTFDGVKSNHIEIDKQLTECGINKRWKIPIIEFLSVLENHLMIKEYHKMRSVLQTYDLRNNGCASIYWIERLFKKYDGFDAFSDIKKIIDTQEMDHNGMMNYENVLVELYSRNGFCAKKIK